MFIGKWNKSVILTYVGLLASIMGMCIVISNPQSIKISLSLLILAGICDMFDGYVARRCKRTEEEKAFGIQLDSLVDVVSFVLFPIVIQVCFGLNQWYHLIIMGLYAICGIARLGYFNITVDDPNHPVKYYTGLPVTFVAVVYPILFLLKAIISESVLQIILLLATLAIAILFISKLKIRKTHGIGYVLFSLLAVIVLILYIVVL